MIWKVAVYRIEATEAEWNYAFRALQRIRRYGDPKHKPLIAEIAPSIAMRSGDGSTCHELDCTPAQKRLIDLAMKWGPERRPS